MSRLRKDALWERSAFHVHFLQLFQWETVLTVPTKALNLLAQAPCSETNTPRRDSEGVMTAQFCALEANHTLLLPYTHSHSLTHTHSHTLSLSLSHTHTHTERTHRHFLSHPVFLFLSVSLALPPAPFLPLPLCPAPRPPQTVHTHTPEGRYRAVAA